MRSMAIVMLGIAWLFLTMRRDWQRVAVGIGAVVLLTVSMLFTWRTMETYPYQFYEAAFIRAIRTGDDQLGTRSPTALYGPNKSLVVGEYSIGAQRMADYILKHVHGREAILTDDSKTFGVMLTTGRPDLFLDRIDYGDALWLDILNNPFGRVTYVLISNHFQDAINVRYTGFPKGYTWAHPVLRSGGYWLFRIDHKRPVK
jgi:hypothetical protein